MGKTVKLYDLGNKKNSYPPVIFYRKVLWETGKGKPG